MKYELNELFSSLLFMCRAYSYKASYRNSTIYIYIPLITLPTNKEKDNNQKASLGNSTLGKLLFLPYAIESIRTVRTRRTMPVNSKVILI
jgi:hypothetical protein